MPGPLQVSLTPQSPAQTPRGQQKTLFASPPSLPYLFSHPRTKTWCWPKTGLFYPTSSSPRGLNLFSSFRIRTGHSRESHPLRASLLLASPKVRRVLHTYARARQPSARSRSRSRSRAAPGVCAARVEKPATRSPAVSGAQGGEEQRAGLRTAPPGPGNARETETRQNKTQAPQSRQRMLAAAPGPAGCSRASQRWSAPGRPSRTFSVHRRVGGRCSERAGTACIPFSNPLSRGSLRAASCALLRTPLSFLHVCWSLWG